MHLHILSMCLKCWSTAGWPRVIGCLMFIGQFPQKSPIISGSFARNDLQLTASYEFSPPCGNTCRSQHGMRMNTRSIKKTHITTESTHRTPMNLNLSIQMYYLGQFGLHSWDLRLVPCCGFS